jgi:flagellar P-ring protein precursor FlgI
MRTILLLLLLLPTLAHGARVKDVARWAGVEDNQLVGVGVVVGLNGTGDGGEAARNLLRNAMTLLGVDVDARTLKAKNAAVVMVTATLPPFARSGDHVDVTVSSMGDARSLVGGTLLATPLKDSEGRSVWAQAQGPLALGGYAAASGGASTQKNHTTTGRVPAGAKVLADVAPNLLDRDVLLLGLRTADFQTAVGAARAINKHLMGDFARALDPGTVEVGVPPQYLGRVPELVARVEALEIEVDRPAKVVVNERTGTVVMGEAVRVRKVAVAHGGLTIEVSTDYEVSQPGAFSSGQTAVVPNTTIEVKEEDSPLRVVGGVTIGELVGGLNQMGVTPRDLISILQAIRAAGALDAEIEVL